MSEPSRPLPATAAAACSADIVRAIAARAGLSQAESQDKAAGAHALIASFQATDPIQMMLLCQAALCQSLCADAAHDVLSGEAGTAKPRMLGQIVALGRQMIKSLEMVIASREEAKAADEPIAEVPAETAGPEAAIDPAAIPRPWAPPRPESWLDEPAEVWLVETPAAALTRAAAARRDGPAEAPLIMPPEIAKAAAGPLARRAGMSENLSR